MQEPVCLEVLFITIFFWASIWGSLEMLADQLGTDARRATFYVSLAIIASILLWATPGLTTCGVL